MADDVVSLDGGMERFSNLAKVLEKKLRRFWRLDVCFGGCVELWFFFVVAERKMKKLITLTHIIKKMMVDLNFKVLFKKNEWRWWSVVVEEEEYMITTTLGDLDDANSKLVLKDGVVVLSCVGSSGKLLPQQQNADAVTWRRC